MAAEFTRSANHSIHSATLADVLERVLDKGLVIAGDVKIKLLDIELLTIQIRLVVASVNKAREMGLDWWTTNPDFQSKPSAQKHEAESIALKDRILQLEARLASSMASARKHSARLEPLIEGRSTRLESLRERRRPRWRRKKTRTLGFKNHVLRVSVELRPFPLPARVAGTKAQLTWTCWASSVNVRYVGMTF